MTQSAPTVSDLVPTAVPSDPIRDTPELSSQREGDSPQETETISDSEGGKDHTSIGVGVGIGVGVSFALVGAFVLWRRYRRKKESQSKGREMFNSELGFQTYHPQGWEMSQPQEKRPHVRADGRGMAAEVPAFPMSPRELAARRSNPP